MSAAVGEPIEVPGACAGTGSAGQAAGDEEHTYASQGKPIQTPGAFTGSGSASQATDVEEHTDACSLQEPFQRAVEELDGTEDGR